MNILPTESEGISFKILADSNLAFRVCVFLTRPTDTASGCPTLIKAMSICDENQSILVARGILDNNVWK